MLPTFYFNILHYNIAYSHYTGDIYSCTQILSYPLKHRCARQEKKQTLMTYDNGSDGLCNHWWRNSVFMTVAWHCHLRLTLCDSLKLAFHWRICSPKTLRNQYLVWVNSNIFFSLCERWCWNEKPEVDLQFEIFLYCVIFKNPAATHKIYFRKWARFV